MTTTPLVIYHANCWDGFCAAWIARKALGDIEAVPAQYGTAPPDVRGRQVFILDFSYPRNVMTQIVGDAEWTCVLDHHKTAEQALRKLDEILAPDLTVVFDMEKSGGRLAWEYFWDWRLSKLPAEARPFSLGVRRDLAPWLVDYTEDRDLWRHALDGTHEINAALRSHPLDFDLWDQFEQKEPRSTFYYEGAAIRRRERQIVEDHVRNARLENFALIVGGASSGERSTGAYCERDHAVFRDRGRASKGTPIRGVLLRPSRRKASMVPTVIARWR